jgi:hypothetical protein
MNPRPLLPMLLLALPLATQAATQAAPPDPEEGRRLVEQHCQSCHKDDLYTRPGRKIGNWNQLRNQVQRCELSLGLKWFDSEIESVTHHLDREFYRFGSAGR